MSIFGTLALSWLEKSRLNCFSAIVNNGPAKYIDFIWFTIVEIDSKYIVYTDLWLLDTLHHALFYCSYHMMKHIPPVYFIRMK